MLKISRFIALSSKNQHKILAKILSKAFEKQESLELYNHYASSISLCPIIFDSHSMNDRFHLHCQKASIHYNEHSFYRETDSLRNTPFLPIDIYCEKLRSAHNVGSIIRTTEALRIGSIHACLDTPLVNHPKVLKTSMQTAHLVPTFHTKNFGVLKKPFFALEVTEKSQNIFHFTFPKSFTLFVGNEQVGLTKQTLDQCETHLSIPLVGNKNSLNVAGAFAIAAALIRNQNDENKN